MINRYHGNSGRVTRIEEGPPAGRPHSPPPPPPKPVPQYSGHSGRNPAERQSGAPILQNFMAQLGKLLPGGLGKNASLETEDIILLLILYLMYRESGDKELLMMMGAMFLL